MYCGDSCTFDGITISIFSIIKHNKDELHFYILTMDYKNRLSLNEDLIKYLELEVKKVNNKSTIKLIDATEQFNRFIPKANIKTKFSPYCMLRLYTDLIPEIPDKILYLDYDVVCRASFKEFYNMDIDNHDYAGALDYYGSHFYRKKISEKDYINSGVLLLNMKLIREDDLFVQCRKLCKSHKMLLPDQHALNLLSKNKLIVEDKYNEQKEIKEDTIFRHFSATFRFYPYFRVQSIKPWEEEKLHSVLNIYEFDDIISKYKKFKEKINNE